WRLLVTLTLVPGNPDAVVQLRIVEERLGMDRGDAAVPFKLQTSQQTEQRRQFLHRTVIPGEFEGELTATGHDTPAVPAEPNRFRFSQVQVDTPEQIASSSVPNAEDVIIRKRSDTPAVRRKIGFSTERRMPQRRRGWLASRRVPESCHGVGT